MLEFTKMVALGNDFVLVDAREAAPANLPGLAVRLCDRHFGIGADGLMLVLPSKKAAFRMRIFNADGSEAEMCGNGIRCFAKYLYDHGLTQETALEIETGAGIIRPVLNIKAGKMDTARVDLGEARLASEEIPMAGPARTPVLRESLEVLGKNYEITCVSMGNPHCVLFWQDLDTLPIAEIGAAVEHHPAFPKRTNVEFLSVESPTSIRMRVWERGVGETLACGTGAAASLVAAVLNERAEPRATLHLLGGNLAVEWDRATNHVFITGPAQEVFQGEIPA